MSRQIALRLPDELVDFVDADVREHGGSRASVVTAALTERRRRARAEADAAILLEHGDYADFTDLGAGAALDDLA